MDLYLLKPKDILWINDAAESLSPPEGVDVRSPQWLREQLWNASAIHHRFVVLSADHLDGMDLSRVKSKLPNRVLATEVCGHVDTPPIEIDKTGPSLTRAYRCWLRRFAMAGRKMPAIVVCDAYPPHFELKAPRIHRDGEPALFYWPSHRMKAWQEQWGAKLDAPVAVIDRHGAELEWFERHGALLYEPHNANDCLRPLVEMSRLIGYSHDELELLALRMAEAALTKILIVDERLDPASARRVYQGDAPRESGERWHCSMKEVFGWKGITLAGSEYGETVIPNEETLLSWMPPRTYDFAVIHRGILDKIRHVHHTGTEELCRRMQDRVERLVVHSGRMGMQDLPEGVNFLPLSNVTVWLDQNFAKLQIVDELNMLRKVG